jgi:hypothetical protein
MPQFRLTLTKEFIVDTDEWEEDVEYDEDDEDAAEDEDENEEDDDEDDGEEETEASGNPLTEKLKAINADPANPTPDQLKSAMQACLEDDLASVVDLDEIGAADFAVELVDQPSIRRS